MNLNTNGRRNFLANAAILTAGFAFASPLKLFAQTESEASLTERWKSFCTMHHGILLPHKSLLAQQGTMNTPTGHHFKTGETIFFQAENMLAQPVWIYWSDKRNTPNDVIISFYSNENMPAKLFRINQFELEGLELLTKECKQTNLLSLLKHERTKKSGHYNQQPVLAIKTAIGKDQLVCINSFSEQHASTIEKKLIYHT